MPNSMRFSPLGFGCAPIMGKVGKNQALQAMELAFDLGVTHFDVARSYGFGQAEQVVGQFIKDKRDKVTVTTKFGVVPPVLSLRTQTIIPIARTVAKLFPQLKARLKNKSGQLLADRNFDVTYARQCLDQSLSELKTDYIDTYLLHEPDKLMLKHPDALIDFLEKSLREGKIRQWGFAFGSIADRVWADTIGGDIIQFEGNLSTLPLCGAVLHDIRPRIVTRPFEGGNTDTLGALLVSLDLLPDVQELNATLSDVALCLSSYLAGTNGTVICSMFSPAHIRNNVQAINRLASNEKMLNIVKNISQSQLAINTA